MLKLEAKKKKRKGDIHFLQIIILSSLNADSSSIPQMSIPQLVWKGNRGGDRKNSTSGNGRQMLSTATTCTTHDDE